MPPTSLSPAIPSPYPAAIRSAVGGHVAKASGAPRRPKPPRSRPSPRPRILLAASLHCAALLKAIGERARAQGWNLLTEMLYTGRFPNDCEADGAIAIARYPAKLSTCLRSLRAPCVTIDLSGSTGTAPSVAPDNRAIGSLAARHLAERGYEAFAWAPFADDAQCREIEQGFAEALAERGAGYRTLPAAQRKIGVLRNENARQWRAEVRRYIKILPRRAAILASSDCVAAQIAECCVELGRAAPDDIGILGIGNDAISCEASPIALASVDLDYERLARQACDMLDSLLAGEPSASAPAKLPPKNVCARASLGLTTTHIPRLDQAIACIDQRFADPNFDINAIADAMAVSRRQLERDFRASMQCSIREYIERRRMTEAARLLPNSQYTVAEVSRRVGITNPGSFFRIFRRRFGVTPNTYRRRAQAKQCA